MINLDRVNLVTLRLLIAIAEEGALTRAAEREAIAPSAASKRLTDLEADLAVSLFHRSSAGMVPTPAGLSMVQHARRILFSVVQMGSELAEHRQGVRGHVRMLTNLSAIVSFLPDDLQRFFAAHPDLRIDLEERPSAGVVRGITEGLAEIGICSADVEFGELAAVTYRRDRLVMIMRPDHALAGTGPFPFAATIDYDQIGLHSASSIFTRSQIAAREAGLPLRLRIHVPGFDAICRTVQAGLGIAIIPEPVFDILGLPMGLHREVLTDDWAQRELKLVHRREDNLSSAALAVKRYLAFDNPRPQR